MDERVELCRKNHLDCDQGECECESDRLTRPDRRERVLAADPEIGRETLDLRVCGARGLSVQVRVDGDGAALVLSSVHQQEQRHPSFPKSMLCRRRRWEK